MAIGTTPLFSKISGSVGPVDYRTRRNGKIEIGKKRIPANPQSTEQTNTRNAYGRLHELWQNAAWIDKTQYENIAAAYDISPWNAFLMRHLPIMRLNPAAYWPFVEGAGNTLHDFTTNNNHGTISGCTWNVTGKYNRPTLYFDGIDDIINCGADPSLDIGFSDFSHIIEFNKTSAPSVNVIIDKRLSEYVGLVIFTDSSKRLKARGGTPGTDLTFHNAYKQNEEIYASVSIERTNLRNIFVNGSNVESYFDSSAINFSSANDFHIGADWHGTGYWCDGYIHSVALFMNTLTNEQSLALYNANKRIFGD